MKTVKSGLARMFLDAASPARTAGKGSSRRLFRISAPLVFFVGASALAIVVRLYLIGAVAPASDVFYYDREAVQYILAGLSPYGQAYSAPAPLATPGAQNVFAWFPFTAVYLVPFQALGTVRFGPVFADALIGATIFQFSRRFSLASSAFYLLAPFTIVLSSYYMNNAIFGVAFLALSVALESRGKGSLAALSLGLALATTLLAWLYVPFYLFDQLRGRRWKGPLLALLVPVAVSLPFVVQDSGSFVYDVLLFQFTRPPLSLVTTGGVFGFGMNPSLSALTIFATGQLIPAYLRGVAVLVLLGALLFRSRGNGTSLARASVFAAVALFILPGDLFFAYLELPLVLFLLWLSQLDLAANPQTVFHEKSESKLGLVAKDANRQAHPITTGLKAKPTLCQKGKGSTQLGDGEDPDNIWTENPIQLQAAQGLEQTNRAQAAEL